MDAPPQSYCSVCHCVIPRGFPRTTVAGEWVCVTCSYDAEKGIGPHPDPITDPPAAGALAA
jgi:hypothetical protein